VANGQNKANRDTPKFIDRKLRPSPAVSRLEMEAPRTPYELTFEERPRYFYAHIKAAEMDYDAAQDYLLEVAKEVDRLGQKRLMIDRDVPEVMARGQLFFTAANLAETFYQIRVAFVNPYPDLDEALNFAALTANNRGANFKVFRDVGSAEKWLLNE